MWELREIQECILFPSYHPTLQVTSSILNGDQSQSPSAFHFSLSNTTTVFTFTKSRRREIGTFTVVPLLFLGSYNLQMPEGTDFFLLSICSLGINPCDQDRGIWICWEWEEFTWPSDSERIFMSYTGEVEGTFLLLSSAWFPSLLLCSKTSFCSVSQPQRKGLEPATSAVSERERTILHFEW